MANSPSYYQQKAASTEYEARENHPSADDTTHGADNSTGARVRAQAADLLHKVLHQRQSLDSLLEAARSKVQLRDQGLFTHLVQGVLRWHIALKSLYEPHLKNAIKPKDQIAFALLSIGVYQARVMRQPDYVAISTVVDASRLVDKPQLAGLINAVLRRTLETSFDIDELQTHPDWLISAINEAVTQREDDGQELEYKTQALLDANDTIPSVWLRILPDSQQHVLAVFESEGVTLKQSAHVDSAFLLPPDSQLSIVEALALGGSDVSVQDISAQALRPVLQRIADQLPAEAKVLDACAAPGGKTALVAQSWPSWSIDAVDQSAQRLERMHENLARHQLDDKIELTQADLLDESSVFYHDKAAHYDAIVLDAPCSAIGVIRRHPDIKHLRVPKTVARAHQHQQQILANAWHTLKPGGFLVYITCSYLLEETQAVIEPFLANHEAQLLPLSMPFFETRDYGSIIWPDTIAELVGEDDPNNLTFMDGFFYALLQKPN